MSIEAFCAIFNGKELPHMCISVQEFFKGKEIWSLVDGSLKVMEDAKDLTAREMKDVHIISWILGLWSHIW